MDASQRSEAVRDKLQSTITYDRNHQHQMDYPRYLANGWQIGSGPVESACNTVVNQRLAGGVLPCAFQPFNQDFRRDVALERRERVLLRTPYSLLIIPHNRVHV